MNPELDTLATRDYVITDDALIDPPNRHLNAPQSGSPPDSPTPSSSLSQ